MTGLNVHKLFGCSGNKASGMLPAAIYEEGKTAHMAEVSKALGKNSSFVGKAENKFQRVSPDIKRPEAQRSMQAIESKT